MIDIRRTIETLVRQPLFLFLFATALILISPAGVFAQEPYANSHRHCVMQARMEIARLWAEMLPRDSKTG
jgi:hypothetical protein